MCGITGFWDSKQRYTQDDAENIVSGMSNSLTHRGPDDSGTWCDSPVGIALGHRRLSILDLSDSGKQPMMSHCGRYVIIFNGEIYNHLQLRKELPPTLGFRGHSDTETLLAGFTEWGIRETIEKTNGMFALAVWDRKEQEIALVRDRVGIKPLYYGQQNGCLFFASELKAIRKHPLFRSELNHAALKLFFRHNYIPAPYSIEQSIKKLPAGSMLTLSRAHPGNEFPDPAKYWDLKAVAEAGQKNSFSGSAKDAKEQLLQLLEQAVNLRTLSDVPLGAFLSGGIDSSLIVALLQKNSSIPAKTFTIGFHEQSHNEAEHAKRVAVHLGTEHTEHYVTAEESRDVIPRLPTMYDEPFSDASQIPTFLVSQLARKHVTVSLSGDGGDELFCGYNRYHHLHQIWQKLQNIPARGMIAGMGWLLGNALSSHKLGRSFLTKASQIGVKNPQELYQALHRHWRDEDEIVLCEQRRNSLIEQEDDWADVPDRRQQWMWLDTMTYLPDDILVKVDRASMAVGLEARVPLLDHRVVEFAWSLPPEMKFQQDEGKTILKEILFDFVPRETLERPKTGFGVPIHEWLRGPLRDWAEALLNEDRIKREGILNPNHIRRKWNQHISGKTDWQYHLWDVLMFQSWLEHATEQTS